MMRIESPLMLNLHRERQAASLTEDSDTDIAVIGGGISGMSAAYSLLTQTDRHVIILERNLLSSGASGHNAGQAVAAFEVPYPKLISTYGKELTDNTYAAVNNAVSSLKSMAEYASSEIADVEALDLFSNLESAKERMKNPGSTCLYVPSDSNEPDAVKLEDFNGQTWSSGYAAATGYHSGIVNCPCLIENLANRLLEDYPDRFEVYEHSPADKISLENDAARIVCNGHIVNSSSVVMCTNGYGGFSLESGSPISLGNKIQPVAGYMIGRLTSPAPAGIRSYVPSNPSEPYYYVTKNFVNSQYVTCAGGLDTKLTSWKDIETWTQDDERKCSMIEAFLLQKLSGFSGPRNYQWKGLMGYTDTGVRLAGKDPNLDSLYYSLGCNGIGILQAVLSADVICKQIDGKAYPRTFFDPLVQNQDSTGYPDAVQLSMPPFRE